MTFIAVNDNLYWIHRTFQSPALKTLNHNLSKAGKFWSVEQGRFVEVGVGEDVAELWQRDYQRATRSAFLFGTLLIFLSWLGLALFVLYFVSIHHLAKSRLEAKIFASDLVKFENFDHNQISQMLFEMEDLTG